MSDYQILKDCAPWSMDLYKLDGLHVKKQKRTWINYAQKTGYDHLAKKWERETGEEKRNTVRKILHEMRTDGHLDVKKVTSYPTSLWGDKDLSGVEHKKKIHVCTTTLGVLGLCYYYSTSCGLTLA
jgi:hypothetical protein